MTQSDQQKIHEQILDAILQMPILCIHSHIDAFNPASVNLAELLGYHYYTELANSAVYEEDWISVDMEPELIVERVVAKLHHVDQTAQYSWFIQLAQAFFGFPHDRLTPENAGELYDAVAEAGKDPVAHEKRVRGISNLQRISLTNNFTEKLGGFDTSVYLPCLRTDDLVFKLHLPETLGAIEETTDISLHGLQDFHDALGVIFDRFMAHQAISAAISMPPNFVAREVPESVATAAFAKAIDGRADAEELALLQAHVMNCIADGCRKHDIPFQLMIGVRRGLYPHGVYQGQDLFTPTSTMEDYAYLFSTYPDVDFPVSVLPTTQEQELRTYGWLVHNVYPSGHWWYANIPEDIAPALAARIGAFPKNKGLGYYSDAYKLEFVLPKFTMYKEVLAQVLTERVVQSQRSRWMARFDVEDAVEIARHLLLENGKRIFKLA